MRPADWPERLDAAIREAAAEPFAWGRHDCFLWAARCVRRLGGPDMLAPVGTWHDEASAAEAIRRWGRDLEAGLGVLCARLGMQEVPPAYARRGDLVCLRTPAGPTAGICIGRQAMAPAPRGVTPLPMTRALRAWGV